MVPEIRKILFTSDLSDISKHAYGYALSLAQRYAAPITFLHVMDEESFNVRSSFLDPKIMEQIHNQTADEARTSLTGKRRDMSLIRSGIRQSYGEESEIIVKAGDIVDTIIETAQKHRCDAIVMGSRRRSALSEAMFGSVVKGVLRRSDRLVVIAPPPQE
jgi:nucleotide-binding universal stress UspA family protein